MPAPQHQPTPTSEAGPAGGPAFSWHFFALTAIAAVTLFARFLHGTFYGFYEDDFYYYALVAKHLVTQHLSTFDGTHLTNGYHPLWLLLLALLYRLFPGLTFFVAVQTVTLAAVLIYFTGLLRCLRLLSVDTSLIRLSALLLSLHALLLFRFGMEVTLTLPLSIWMLATVLDHGFYWTPQQTTAFGLLGCLMALSRIDSLLLFVLVLVARLRYSSVSPRLLLKRSPILLTCFLPFFAYLAINLHVFHLLLPVSGLAKQLKPLWPPSAATLISLILPVDRNRAAFVYPALLLSACGLALLWRARRRLPAPQTAILAALFAFPALHFLLLSLLSDWVVWPWYFYSLTFPVLASLALVLIRPQATPRLHTSSPTRAAVLAACITLYAVYLFGYAIFRKPSLTSRFALFVAAYSESHPGIYAMGDDSGLSAFRSPSPFIQLEGLMMDAEYLQLLRGKTPLPQVLARYGADYYVTLGIERQGLPCFTTHEPEQAGSRSPRLPGRICAQPLAQYFEDGVSVGIFRAGDVLYP